MANTNSARALRARRTPAEARLWRLIRDRRLGGLKFRRQVPFGPFVVDFLCDDARLVIEIDGSIHDEHEVIEYDTYRTAFIRSHGFRVIRFRNEEILENAPRVLRQILDAAQARLEPRSS